MKQQALGMIETRGLVGAIEAADKAVKAAEVKLLGYQLVTGGLVMVAVTGEVAAVQAAVSAGSVAAARTGQLISQHVIPRPLAEIRLLFHNTPDNKKWGNAKKGKNGQSGDQGSNSDGKNRNKVVEPLDKVSTIELTEKSEEDLKQLQHELQSMTVANLRKIARKTEGIAIRGRQISRANKEKLIREILQARQQKSNGWED